MHKIKAQARRGAWYNSDGEKTYNPFQRYNPHVRTGLSHDEESGLREVNTHDGITPTDGERRSQYNAENAPYRGPEKAGTFPQASSAGLRGGVDYSSTERSRSGDRTVDDDGYGDKPRETPAERVKSTESTPSEQAKPKKRAKFLSAFGKKHSDEADVKRTETDDSKKKKKRPKIPFMHQFKAVFGSWINVLLIAVPVGIALEYADVNKVAVFVVNFIAIIPLAAVLSYSTEELAMYIGEVLGGLLNATFGNAVELIVSIIALTQGKVLIVQTSLIGSMLSNLLLVLGMCFFLGGLRRQEQHFNITVAQTAASLLALAIGSLIIPTAYSIFADDDAGVTPSSRGTAVMLLAVYACYLLFQLRTHVDMYNEPSQKTPKKPRGKKEDGEALKGLAMIGAASGAAAAGGQVNQENLVHEAPDEEETPSLSIMGAVVTLAISTVFIALCAEYMVSAINAVATSVSQEFIGLILLPIVGNAAEHATAVTVAIKDKMDLSIGVAVGSSLQIALLVLPLMVLFSWFGIGKPDVLNLDFDGFLVVILVLSIWLVNYLISDGKSHWLEGVMLMMLYLIIATTAWFYPAKGDVAG